MKSERYDPSEDMFKRTMDSLGESYFLVGCDMFQSIHEKAYEIGGADFAEEVTDVAFEGFDVLPNPDALRLLVERNPNIGNSVMDRAREIMQKRHQTEIKSRFPIRGRLRKFGKALIDANTLIWTGQKPA